MCNIKVLLGLGNIFDLMCQCDKYNEIHCMLVFRKIYLLECIGVLADKNL